MAVSKTADKSRSKRMEDWSWYLARVVLFECKGKKLDGKGPRVEHKEFWAAAVNCRFNELRNEREGQ